MAEIIKKYTNGEVTIIWKPSLCIHSRICWGKANSLPEVFKPAEKPWIKPDGAITERIIEQVKLCPSGALTFEMNEDVAKEEIPIEQPMVSNTLECIPNGPILVNGNFTIKDSKGNITTTSTTALCRCGHSANKPYCDGSHIAAAFEG